MHPMMAYGKTISLLLVGAALAACASTPPRRLHLAEEQLADTCPLDVEATVVTPELVDGGVAYVFTTVSDVAEVRRRVRLAARLHSLRWGAGRASLVLAATDDVPDGARLKLRPIETDEVPLMQATLPGRAQLLERVGCRHVPTEGLVAWLVTEPAAPRDGIVTSR